MSARGRALPWVALAAGGCADTAGSPTRLAALFAAFVAVAVTLGLVHLLLWAFAPRERQNLWFAVLAAAFALVAHLDYRERLDDPLVVPGLGELQRYAVTALILAAARFAYSLGSSRAPRRFWVYLAAISTLLVVALFVPQSFDLPAGLLGLAVTIDALVTGLRSWRRLERPGWIVALGAAAFAVGGVLQLGLDLGGADELGNALAPYLWGGLALLLAISVYLAFAFVANLAELEHRLVEVETLSARALEQERAAREEEVRRRLLEAENDRRRRELEEARRLQLALLPRRLPAVAGYEVAAAMVTATEVGGDYYDLAAGDEEAWLAVGDAVGHGARAGTLVAVAKSLFVDRPAEPDPAALLHRFDRSLRGMGLPRAHLALALARLRPGRVALAVAGMPSPVVWRAATGQAEEVAFAALPLGTPLAAQYASREVTLAPGDLLLLSSDGLAEVPGPDGRPRGYDAARELVAEAADATELTPWLDAWAARLADAGAPPDDVTVVLLRAR